MAGSSCEGIFPSSQRRGGSASVRSREATLLLIFKLTHLEPETLDIPEFCAFVLI